MTTHKNKIGLGLCLLLVTALVLSACGKNEPARESSLAADGATPELAVTSAIDALKAGHFDSLMQHAMPPEAYKAMRAEWEADRKADLAKITDADRKRFDQEMHKLTAPDAKQQLMKQLQPVLDQYPTKYKQRVPMMVGIGRIMAESKITESKTLDPEQKSQARGVLDAVGSWVQDTDWGDKDKAEKAVDIVVDTARALDIQSLDAAYQLDYEQAMQRYATAWKGVKNLLDVYGFSVDDILDSAKVTTASKDGDKATVNVTYKILDKPMTSTLDMVRVGKRWYGADVIKQWREQQAQAAATASSTTEPVAPAGTD